MFSANSLLFHLLQNWRLLASVCELMGPTDFNFHITHVSLSPSVRATNITFCFIRLANCWLIFYVDSLQLFKLVFGMIENFFAIFTKANLSWSSKRNEQLNNVKFDQTSWMIAENNAQSPFISGGSPTCVDVTVIDLARVRARRQQYMTLPGYIFTEESSGACMMAPHSASCLCPHHPGLPL